MMYIEPVDMPYPFLEDGGEMGAFMRKFDWSDTPLGDPSTWPPSLRAVLSACINSPAVSALYWGPEFRLLYNDAFAPFLEEGHPRALGQPMAKVWPDLWQVIGPQAESVLATGRGFVAEDQKLVLKRDGRSHETYWFYNFAPIRGETGIVAGILLTAMDTTAKTLSERRLAAERERLMGLFDQAHGFMAMLRGPQHVFELINPSYMKLVGHRDVVGKPVREALPEIEGQGFFELLDDVYASGKGFRGEAMRVSLQRTPGDLTEESFINLVYQPVVNATGAVTGIFVEGHDITEMHLAQTALRKSEAFNQRVLASSDDCIKVLDLEARLTFMSEGGQRVMEVGDFNAIEGCPWPQFWQGQGNLDAKAAVAAAKAGQSAQFQGHAPTMAGTPRFWDVRVTPILDADGRPEKILSISRDITATWQAEEALRKLNESLEERVVERTAERDQMWNTSPDLMLIIDFDGVFRRVNPAWTTLLGYTSHELVGHHVNEFVLADDAAVTTTAYEYAAAGGQPCIENRYRHKDGSVRWISWVAAPAENVSYATGRDITAEKERQAELAQAQDALRQSQKMEAVGQLTGGLAHDFNNLLAGISGSLELMQSRMRQGRHADVDRYMAAAQGASKRAAALTHRLLAFSRRQTLDPKPTDVNRLVVGMEELIRRTVGPAVHIEVVGAGGLWSALIDPPQLENALLNLCINARDAMPDGGRITIETANRWMDERAARQHDLPKGQYLSLCVTDTGTGMPPEMIARVFEPFFTTKPLGQGTGLGLSMIYGFAQQSGGQVRIYSEVGKGTTVCIYLPRHYGEVEDDDGPAHEMVLTRSDQGETVLIVDDEPTVRMLVTDILADLGYTAIEAGDSATGLKLLQSDVRIDLLITDVGLPGGMNGRQMADAGRVVRPGLKVLFITGYAENAAVGNGYLAPGMAVLTKPFPIETMAARIRSMIAA